MKAVLRHTSKIIVSAILISCFLVAYPVWAYWGNINNPQENEIQNQFRTGVYYYGAVEWKPNTAYPANIVVVKDGVPYITDMDIPADDPYQNPDNPVTSWTRGMRYRYATAEYEKYNYYTKGDYAVYNGKTYELTELWHSPNTISAVSPENTSAWKLVANYPMDTWYRYKIYEPGAIINYNGKWYQCITTDCFFHQPPDADWWSSL